jgi:hypothetical protein
MAHLPTLVTRPIILFGSCEFDQEVVVIKAEVIHRLHSRSCLLTVHVSLQISYRQFITMKKNLPFQENSSIYPYLVKRFRIVSDYSLPEYPVTYILLSGFYFDFEVEWDEDINFFFQKILFRFYTFTFSI